MSSGWLGLDWGDVPTWIGSIVTSTSVAVAALSYRRSVLEKERGQASLVTAWVALREQNGEHLRVLQVSNASEASVYEVGVRFDRGKNNFVPELPGKATVSFGLPPDKAGFSGTAIWDNTAGKFVELLGWEVTTERAPADLEFRDAVGRIWRRSPDGSLTRLRERTILFTQDIDSDDFPRPSSEN
jgi:hypothetical protein